MDALQIIVLILGFIAKAFYFTFFDPLVLFKLISNLFKMQDAEVLVLEEEEA